MFVSKYGIWEKALGLGEQGLLLLGGQILCGIVADDEFIDASLLGDLCSLQGGAVATVTGFLDVLVLVGGFVIKKIRSLDDGDDALGVDGIAAEGILLRWRGLGGQEFVWNNLATLGIGPIDALLDAGIVSHRNLQFATTIDEQMTVTRQFLEQESGSRYAMMERDGADAQGLILVDDLALQRIVGLESHLHRKLGTEEIEQRTEDPLGIGVGMDDDLAGPLSQTQRGDETDEAEAMVTMQMAEQDVSDLADSYVVLQQSDLYAFATIDKEQVATEVDNLRRWAVPKRGLGTTASEYGDVEAIHEVREEIGKVREEKGKKRGHLLNELITY